VEMNTVWLCRYSCLMCAMLFPMTLLISYGPGADTFAFLLQGGTACGTLLAGILAILANRLPPSHWVHQSLPAWIILAAVAVTVTAMMVSAG
jgi:hypothetical protein